MRFEEALVAAGSIMADYPAMSKFAHQLFYFRGQSTMSTDCFEAFTSPYFFSICYSFSCLKLLSKHEV